MSRCGAARLFDFDRNHLPSSCICGRTYVSVEPSQSGRLRRHFSETVYIQEKKAGLLHEMTSLLKASLRIFPTHPAKN
jgi:hypothetical protein